ncbi:MAG: DUF3592 domain-containing protein [Polyangiales bacterium]
MRDTPATAMVFAALGPILTLGAVVSLLVRRARFARWTRGVGTVVGFRVRRSRRNGRYRTYHHPQVRYLAGGREWLYESPVSTSSPQREVGASVAMIHDPANPQEACIDEVAEKYFVSLLVGAIGAVFTAVAVWMYLRVPPVP